MINEIDLDCNGYFEFQEFAILMHTKVLQMSRENEITEAFNVLDKEKDNHISVKELKYFMRKVAQVNISSELAEAMVVFADGDQDGLVTFDDFAQIYDLVMMEKQRQGSTTKDNRESDLSTERQEIESSRLSSSKLSGPSDFFEDNSPPSSKKR